MSFTIRSVSDDESRKRPFINKVEHQIRPVSDDSPIQPGPFVQRTHNRNHSLERCLLHCRSEVLWDSVISIDLLGLRNQSPKNHSLKSNSSHDDERNVRNISSRDDSNTFLSPILFELAKLNQSCILTYTNWLKYSKQLFNCTTDCAKLYFETFIRVHNWNGSQLLLPKTSIDLCEFLVFLYLQQQWPTYQRNYRSINKARRIPLSPRSPTSPSRSPHSPIRNTTKYTFSMGNSDDERKDADQMKTKMMDIDVGLDVVEGETEAEETFEEMSHFLRLHLTNILCLLKDPIQLQLIGNNKLNSSSSNSSSGSDISQRRTQEHHKKSPLPPTYGDAYAHGEQNLVTLHSHEFDRLAFLLTFNNNQVQFLSELTPFWKAHTHVQVSVATLREWVLRFVHPLPLNGLRPFLSAGSPVIWSYTYPHINIGLVSHARCDTLICDELQLKSGDFHIKDCSACTVILNGKNRFVSITRCQQCTINVGVVSLLLRIEDCNQVIINGVVNSVRIANCVESTFYLYTGSRPIIIGRNRITLAPFNKPTKEITKSLMELDVLKKLDENQWLCKWDANCWKEYIYIEPNEAANISMVNNINNDIVNNRNDNKKNESVLSKDEPTVKIMNPKDFVLKSEFLQNSTAVMSNSCPLVLPKEYLVAINERNKTMKQLKQIICERKLTTEQQREFQNALDNSFQNWMKQRFGGAEAQYISNLKKVVQKLETRSSPMRNIRTSPYGSVSPISPSRNLSY